jgi:hypothetical protein
MADEQTNDQGRASAAPYTAFSSIKTAVKLMKEHGLPSRIDRSVLTNFSGAVVTQVMTALKFLGLIDGDGRPTASLKILVETIDDENTWPTQLAEVIRGAYAPLFTIDLERASPSQFHELFKKSYPGADDVVRKSVTFFLNATREAKIPVSPYIMKNKKPRNVFAKRRTPRQKPTTNADVSNALNAAIVHAATPQTVTKPLEYLLLDLINQDMEKEEREAVWTLINYLKRRQP